MVFVTAIEEIKFHDPNDFAQAGDGGVDQGVIANHGGGAHPEARVSHTHSLGGNPSDHE